MTEEQKEILAVFETMQKAMIDKDMDTLCRITAEDKTFTHMSGKTQTREEFFSEIADGTLNYYQYTIHDPVITAGRDYAVLNCRTTLKAKVYGMQGSWTLHTEQYFRRNGSSWIICNKRKA